MFCSLLIVNSDNHIDKIANPKDIKIEKITNYKIRKQNLLDEIKRVEESDEFNKEKIIEFNNNIGTLKDAVTKLEPEYEKNSKLFHSKKEVEDLYQNISKFALLNGLSIVNLKKSEPTKLKLLLMLTFLEKEIVPGYIS